MSADDPMDVRTALLTSARDLWQASASRFGQAHAVANARRAATGLLRERVAREEVRIYLETLEAMEARDTGGAATDAGSDDGPARPAATGSDS